MSLKICRNIDDDKNADDIDDDDDDDDDHLAASSPVTHCRETEQKWSGMLRRFIKFLRCAMLRFEERCMKIG